jgi:hypothetical protein
MNDVQKLFNGATVTVQGHEFTVSELFVKNDVAYFTGTCTNDRANKSIKNTGYDGAVYGGNKQVYDWD